MPAPSARFRSVVTLLALALAPSACVDDSGMDSITKIIDRTTNPKPDELPVMQGTSPFHYPTELYDQRVQGNVTLRIFIDSLGTVHPESTQVVESSGHPPLDSAAVKGTQSLSFAPARLRGRPVPASILIPVYYRHPDEPPMPGDSILRRPTTPSSPATTP